MPAPAPVSVALIGRERAVRRLDVGERDAVVRRYRLRMILPGSWAAMLEPLRPAFRRRGTFTLFTVLAAGMVAPERLRRDI
jgi:hypothetical protein